MKLLRAYMEWSEALVVVKTGNILTLFLIGVTIGAVATRWLT